MRVLLGRTPTCLVVEHEEDVALLSVIEVMEILVQVIECQETVGNKIVFYAFVLEVPVNRLNVLQVLEREWDQLVWLLVLIVRDHQRSVEPVVTEEFEFLSIVVSSQSLF